MVKITAEVNGKKYELINEIHLCDECAFLKEGILCGCNNFPRFNQKAICAKLHGIWKEVKDGD